MSQGEVAEKRTSALRRITPQVQRAASRPGNESVFLWDDFAYGGRSRAAIQASAR